MNNGRHLLILLGAAAFRPHAVFAQSKQAPILIGWLNTDSRELSGHYLSYSADALANYRHAAYYVDRILKGTKPRDLPIEQPTKFELVVNMKTAKMLGIKIPNSILVQATKVIE